MPDRFRKTLAGIAAALCFVTSIGAAGAPTAAAQLNIKSDGPLVIDTATGEGIFRHNARLDMGDWLVSADEIRVNYKTNEAHAQGDVLVTRPGLRMLADSAVAHGDSKMIEAFGFRFGKPPLYIAGRHAHGTAEVMHLDDVELFYGEPGSLTPRATAKSLTLYKDDRMEAKGMRVGVGHFPIAGMTGLSRPLAAPHVIWESRIGFDSQLGLHLGAGAYIPYLPGFSPGGSFDVFSKRGVLAGPGARYESADGSDALTGSADFAYIRDHGDRENDILGNPIDRDRYYGEWRHVQQIDDRWSLNGEVNIWSDSEVLRDFRSDVFTRDMQPDNFVELASRGRNYIASAFTRFRPNDFELVPERLPEIRFDLLPMPLGVTGVLLEGQTSAAALTEKHLDGAPETRSDRVDTYAAVSRTFVPENGIAITPVVGGRFTYYSRAENGRDTYSRWLGEVGFDAHLRATAARELDKPIWGINGIRHVIEPYLSYRYVPEADRGRSFIPAVDEPEFLTQLQPLGLADRRDIDALSQIDVVRLGVKNILETRRADYGSRQLLHLDLAADHHFSHDRTGHEFSDIQTELGVTPVDWLEGWVFVRTGAGTFGMHELNTRFVIKDGNAWSFALDSSFLKHVLQQYGVTSRYALNEANTLYGRLRYDALENRFNEVQVGLERRVAQNWIVRGGVTLRNGQQREANFGVKLEARFLAF